MYIDRSLSSEGMIGRQEYLERFFHKRPVLQVAASIFPAQKRHINSTMQQSLGKLRRVLSRNHHMNIRQFITKKLQRFRKPRSVVPDHKTQSKRWLRWEGRPPRGLHCNLCLGKHHACMVQKHSPRRRQFHAPCSSYEKRRAHFIFEIPNLATQRWLRDMQRLFRSQFEAPRFGNSHKVTKMPELQKSPLPKKHTPLHRK